MSHVLLNPFITRRTEHLATIRDLEIFLSSAASVKRAELKKHHKTWNKHRVAVAKDDIERLETACAETYSCDPWKYEPVLLDMLVELRMSGASDREMDRVRGLIRAGSWMQYPRMDEDAIRKDIHRLRRRAHTSHDHRLAEMERLFSERAVGHALRPAVLTIEDLSLHAWLSLKKIAAAHGIRPSGTGAHLKTLQNEITDLRVIRDALYFRLLYPTIAAKNFS